MNKEFILALYAALEAAPIIRASKARQAIAAGDLRLAAELLGVK